MRTTSKVKKIEFKMNMNKRKRKLLTTQNSTLRNVFFGGEDKEEDERVEDLRERAIQLARSEKHRESLCAFNQIIARGCKDAKVYEMKSQVLMEMDKTFEAIQAAEVATNLEPEWYLAWKTLARAQLNFGEANLALKSAERAMKLSSPKIQDSELLEFLQEVRCVVLEMIKNGKNGDRIKVL